MSQSPEPNPFQSPKTVRKEATNKVARVSDVSQWLVWATLAGIFLLVAELYWVAPGLGIVAAMVCAPALLRVVVRLWKEARLVGAWPQPGGQFAILVSSVLISVPVVFTSAMAFFAVCTAGALVVGGLFRPTSDDPYGLQTILRVGFTLGGLVGLVVLGYLWTWSVKKRILWEKELPLPENAEEGSEA